MKTVRRLAPALTLLALATPALAQPGAMPPGAEEMPPPPPEGTVVTITPQPQPVAQPQQQPVPVMAVVAPLNEDWRNVNHINGHPVPVGQRGDYLHTWKKTSISTNPIGWMFGFYGVSVTHALGTNVAIRADANIFDFDNESGYEVGLSVPLYFKRVFQGPFLEPGIIARGINDSCSSYDDYCGGSEYAMVGPEVLFGWHWTFDSGANVALAFGAAKNMNRQSEYDLEVEPAGYFRIGYAF